MRLPRRAVFVAMVPIVLATGIFACGGRVAEDGGADASPGRTSSATGTTTPSSPAPTPTPTDAGGGPGRFDAGSEFTLDVTGCVSRPDTCHWSSGSSTPVVEAWMADLVAGCPATPPNCGTMKMKFSRLPDFGGCGQALTFSVAQPVDFILCLEKVLSTQRCSTGLWVGSGADVDTQSIELCASP